MYSNGDFQYMIQCRDHEVITDQPNGQDKRMPPPELMIGALGACIGVYVEYYYRNAGIGTKKLLIKLRYEKEGDPPRIKKIAALVNLRANPGDRKDAILKAANSCLIHRTLTTPPNVDIRRVLSAC